MDKNISWEDGHAAAPVSVRQKRSAHLPYVHRARAIAILLIVLLHTLSAADWKANPALQTILFQITSNSSVLFFFISGFLFQHLSDNFEYCDFLAKKLNHVVIPFLMVSLPGIFVSLTNNTAIKFNPELQGIPWWECVLFLYIYAGSQIDYPLWYVPVIVLFFFVSPVLFIFTRYPKLYFSLFALVPISFFIHRPSIDKYHNLHLFLYFLSVYIFGMLASQYRSRMELLVVKYRWFLLSGFFSIVIIGSYTSIVVNNSIINDELIYFVRCVDWSYVKNILLIFAIFGFLLSVDYVKQLPIVDYIGTTSFAIYIIHMYVLYLIAHMLHWVEFDGTILSAGLMLIFVVSVCVGIAIATRRYLGRASKFLIGV